MHSLVSQALNIESSLIQLKMKLLILLEDTSSTICLVSWYDNESSVACTLETQTRHGCYKEEEVNCKQKCAGSITTLHGSVDPALCRAT